MVLRALISAYGHERLNKFLQVVIFLIEVTNVNSQQKEGGKYNGKVRFGVQVHTHTHTKVKSNTRKQCDRKGNHIL